MTLIILAGGITAVVYCFFAPMCPEQTREHTPPVNAGHPEDIDMHAASMR